MNSKNPTTEKVILRNENIPIETDILTKEIKDFTSKSPVAEYHIMET